MTYPTEEVLKVIQGLTFMSAGRPVPPESDVALSQLIIGVLEDLREIRKALILIAAVQKTQYDLKWGAPQVPPDESYPQAEYDIAEAPDGPIDIRATEDGPNGGEMSPLVMGEQNAS